MRELMNGTVHSLDNEAAVSLKEPSLKTPAEQEIAR
jgi:hypothetical protein